MPYALVIFDMKMNKLQRASNRINIILLPLCEVHNVSVLVLSIYDRKEEEE